MPKPSTSKGTVKIKLTRGYFALVDAGSEQLKYKWGAQVDLRRIGKPVYGVRQESKTRKKLWLHKEVLGVRDGVSVDHINGDTLDCRKINLRLATRTQNGWNRLPNRGTIYKGICDKGPTCPKRPWQARITIHGRRRNLGYFSTPEEAALVYNEAAKIYFGEFARLNVIL